LRLQLSTIQSAQLNCWCFGRNDLYINTDTTAKAKRINTVRQTEQKMCSGDWPRRGGVDEMIRAFV
jgi:hypothetical protein